MTLPSEKTKPEENPLKHIVLLYGPPKVGKSTFVSQADATLFLATEPGLNSLECYQVTVKTWEELLSSLKDVATEEHQFHTLCIDTIDNAYQFCAEYTCRKFGIEYLGDAAHGKAWAVCSNEFSRVLTKLAHLPMGLFLISHSQEKEFQTRTGTILKTVPTMPDRARRIVLGLADIILYAELEEQTAPNGERTVTRVIRTSPTARYEAGDRTGKLPETLPLNFKAFQEAFKNNTPPPPVPPPTHTRSNKK